MKTIAQTLAIAAAITTLAGMAFAPTAAQAGRGKQSSRQTVGGQLRTGNWFGRRAKAGDSPRPEVHIAIGGHRDAGNAGTQGCAGGAGAGMMDRSSHPGKEPDVRRLIHSQQVRWKPAAAEVTPAAKQHDTSPRCRARPAD